MMSTPLAKHALREPVAFGAGGERSACDLLRDAAWLAEQLPPATAGSQVLIAIGKDRYAFCAALLGTWLRGHAAALPWHTGRDAILRIAQQSDTAAVVHDTATSAALRVDVLLAATPSALALPPLPLALPDLLVTFYSEDMQASPQRRCQLLGEAQTLMANFELANGLRFASTLPPGHPYGLMLGVLVPCLSGGAFLREVSSVVTSEPADVLVSAPAHLRDTAASALAGFAQVFSSRAPLTAAVVAGCGRPIVDLFGTTKTGSLAYRTVPAQSAFHPLPGVSASADHAARLTVTGEFGAFVSEDRVTLTDDGGFVLVGSRSEPSVASVAARLAAISGVLEVAVVAIDAEGERAPELLAAVVAPGWDEARLLERLRAGACTAVMPDRVLCVERLWRDDAGRYPRARLLMLFGRQPDGRPLNFTLEWGGETVSVEAGRERRVYSAHVPSDYGYFAGHFPGYPILPGAAQLSDLVLPCVRRARPRLGALALMTRVKFLDRIKPGEDVEVVLTWRDDEPSVEFALRRADTLCATGKLGFGAAVPP
jgi:hypothetical protein